MHLLHLVSSLDPAAGGVSQAIRSLLPGLTDYNITNQVVTLDAPSAPFLGGDSFKVEALGPGRGPWQWCPRLDSWLDLNLPRFGAVIVHGLWQYQSWSVFRALRRRRGRGGEAPRLFVMPHGMLDPWFQRDPSRRIKAFRNKLFWQGVERHLVHSADGILFTCEEEKLLARTAFAPYRPKGEFVVGLGISAPPPETAEMAHAFRSLCPGLRPDRPYLVFLGRIHPKKGVDLLIRAYAEFRDRAMAKGAEASVPDLVIAGPGLAEPYGREMLELAAALVPGFSSGAAEEPGASSVYFPGMLAGDAKWGALYGASAFVLPSHQENFGIAVVEALGCGTPVLISDKVNIWREIAAAGAGFAEPDTVEGTLKGIGDWNRNRGQDQSRQLSEAARHCVDQHFTIESAARRLAEVITGGGVG